MGKNNQYNSPTVARAIKLECEVVKDILGAVHPKGAPVKDIAKEFKKREGYLLQSHTIQTRLNTLVEKDEVHRAVQSGKYGASLWILGPAPEPEVQESLPFNADEPALAGDELISLVMHNENHAQVRYDRLVAELKELKIVIMSNNELIGAIHEKLIKLRTELGG